MGNQDDLSLTVRAFIKLYRWRRIDPVPWTNPPLPLSQCRLGLVSSAGFVAPGQKPFDDSILGGDWSFREIPVETDLGQLREFHRSESFDHAGLQQDPNLVFPLDRLRELVAAKDIGSLNQRHLSFMGSIPAPGRLIRETAPQAAQLFVEDQVQVALLVPV